MKLLIINNPNSGYQNGTIFDFIRSAADEDTEITLRTIGPNTTTDELLADADNFDVVIPSGGDGTVCSVAYRLLNTGIKVMPFPAGTSNALAMNLMSPDEPHALAKLVKQGRTMDFDMGELSAGEEKHGFSLVAGCGYDATIMQSAQDTKAKLGPMAYFHAAFSNPTPTQAHFIITVDGETIERDGLSVLVANFSKMQFELALTHENLPRDGLLDIMVLKTPNALGLIPAFITTWLDRSGGFPDRGEGVETFRGKEISIVSDPPLPIQYDGEPTELTTPATFSLIPKSIRYVVSQACAEHYYDESEDGPLAQED
ncbi:MAG: diacylglycerol/lipid kinase family protein [Eggerthellaceae bacterium]